MNKLTLCLIMSCSLLLSGCVNMSKQRAKNIDKEDIFHKKAIAILDQFVI